MVNGGDSTIVADDRTATVVTFDYLVLGTTPSNASLVVGLALSRSASVGGATSAGEPMYWSLNDSAAGTVNG